MVLVRGDRGLRFRELARVYRQVLWRDSCRLKRDYSRVLSGWIWGV